LEIVEKDIKVDLFNNKDNIIDSNNNLINDDQYLNDYKVDIEKSLQRKFNLSMIPEINTNIVISDSNNNIKVINNNIVENELEYKELNNYKVTPSTPVQIMCNDISQLAVIKKHNKNGSYKVIYHDGRKESNVSVDRICILQSDLEYNDKLSLMYAAADTLFDVEYNGNSNNSHISNDMLDNNNNNNNIIDHNDDYDDNNNKYNSRNSIESSNKLGKIVLEKCLVENSNNNDDDEDGDKDINDDIEVDNNNNKYNNFQYYTSKDFRIIFNNPPFGMTVTKKISTGSAEITRIIPDGNASKSGIEIGIVFIKILKFLYYIILLLIFFFYIGDILIGIGLQFVSDYDDAMNILKLNKTFPLEIVFRRKILTNNNNNDIV
jgi:hypothetical protein